jgi:hypothetical protein
MPVADPRERGDRRRRSCPRRPKGYGSGGANQIQRTLAETARGLKNSSVSPSVQAARKFRMIRRFSNRLSRFGRVNSLARAGSLGQDMAGQDTRKIPRFRRPIHRHPRKILILSAVLAEAQI